MKLQEAKMSAGRFMSALKNSSIKIGFEFEFLVSPDSKFYKPIMAQIPPQTLDLRTISDEDELRDIPGFAKADRDKVRQMFWDWQDVQIGDWLDKNWKDFVEDEDTKEAHARDEAEYHIQNEVKQGKFFQFEEFFAEEFSNPKERFEELGFYSAFGWQDDHTVFLDMGLSTEERYTKTWIAIEKEIANDLLVELSIPGFGKTSAGMWELESDSSITDSQGRQDHINSDDPNNIMDGYGYELISPPLPANEAIDAMNEVFDWMKSNKIETNSSTGLHINMSMDNLDDLDPVKLILFMGDDYIINKFDRATSKYSKSQLQNLFWYVKNAGKTSIKTDQKAENGIYDIAKRTLKASTKYYSVNFNKLLDEGNKYLEFRAAGNKDYHLRSQDIIETIGRLATALNIACDRNAYRQEFLKKLILLGADNKDSTNDPLAKLFGDDEMYDELVQRITDKSAPTYSKLSQFKILINTVYFEVEIHGKDLKTIHINRMKELFVAAGTTPAEFYNLISKNRTDDSYEMTSFQNKMEYLKLLPKTFKS